MTDGFLWKDVSSPVILALIFSSSIEDTYSTNFVVISVILLNYGTQMEIDLILVRYDAGIDVN